MISPASRPASSAPRRYAAMTFGAAAGSASVHTPSARRPATSAACSWKADMNTGGRRSGRRYSRAPRVRKKSPWWSTVSPSSRRVMIDSDSSVRASCSAVSGQSMPAGTSFIASLEPTPRNARPGNMTSRVAICCATTTGL